VLVPALAHEQGNKPGSLREDVEIKSFLPEDSQNPRDPKPVVVCGQAEERALAASLARIHKNQIPLSESTS